MPTERQKNDQRRTTDFYLAKNGMSEVTAERHCKEQVVDAIRTAGLPELAKALSESFDFKFRHIGQFANR